ncbi:DUF4900 domain-containing protein [Deinococcus marmoris]|uniref:Type 4 fimbrial biogenesis protein PilX N-terminal domain-containing protein n=1 Tax=Deinococcus marmoris TaxID=249408 RepID=A0A1U7NRY2_9DEIO|nr:DUF4900 domain-containing protein [Deinococcus marmoris]OLV15667.1 hypothetical protein BOO71_0014206 [Deinococcus marmoris]
MPTSPRIPARTTEGATLIVSLLFVMLLLAVIMSVTAQVTLSSRRSSVDQQALLSARYAAESGVARVQARLKVMKALLDDATIPAITRNSAVESQIAAMCGLAVLPPQPLPTPANPSPVSTVCTFPADGLRGGGGARAALLTNAVKATDFAKEGFRATDDSARARFWGEMFSGTAGMQYSGSGSQNSDYGVTFGLIPTRLDRQRDQYRLYFEVPSALSQGVTGSTTQRLSARATTDGKGEYYLLISREPFAKFGLFTNRQFQSPEAERNNTLITFTERTLFSGPVHTNGRFTFYKTPTFWGEVTSAGCPPGPGLIGDVAGKPGCLVAAQPGAQFGVNPPQLLTPAQMTGRGPPDELSTAQAPRVGENQPQFKSSVKWDADFIPLPTNSQNQRAAALGYSLDPVTGQAIPLPTAGLALSGDVQEMQLWRDMIGGQERQRISYVQGGAAVDLSYDQNGTLFILNPSRQWVPAGRDAAGNVGAVGGTFTIVKPFNGVVSVQDGKIANLNGGPNVAQSGPAGASIASFAGVTVAATGDVNITSSLKYTVPPCGGQNTETAAAPCDRQDAQNILGIYASGKTNANGSKVPANINLISPKSCPDGIGNCPNIGVNPQIHAVLMASQGAVQVEGYNQGSADNSLGKVNLIGGIIEDYYGAFGQTDGHGYGRNFVYDQRTYDGFSPPAFPTQKDWTVVLRLKATDQDLQKNTGLGIRLQGDAVSAGK